VLRAQFADLLRALPLPGLRTWPIQGFDELRVYYLVRDDFLTVVRVLHGRRDIGSILENQCVDDPPPP
jgi:toxin ParE1/3/4